MTARSQNGRGEWVCYVGEVYTPKVIKTCILADKTMGETIKSTTSGS